MEPQKENPLSEVILAEDSEQGAGGVSGLPARIARYEKARQRALSMESFARNSGHVKEANRLHRCGNYLLFRHYYTVDTVKLHAADFCKQHLLCPLCAIRRGAKLLKAYLSKFEYVRDCHENWHPYLVTFTVKNGEDLRERFRHLSGCLRALHKRRQGTRQSSEVEKAQAAVWSFEVTNKGNGWHPHVHAVWLCSSEPDQDRLRQEWAELTGDSFMVDVRPLQGDPVDGFCEVFKYAVKFSELPNDLAFEAYEVLGRKRLVASFGAFRGISADDSYIDDPLPDDLPYIDMLYRFVHSADDSGYYNFIPLVVDRERKPSVINLPSASRSSSPDKDYRGPAIVYHDHDGRRFWYSRFTQIGYEEVSDD